jgi:uncharacterized membrane protein YeaQ/YmgE (transglycosylase-associated protein family)
MSAYLFGQLTAMGVIGLLIGLLTQKFAKKRRQEKLGTFALVSCVIASFVGGFLNMYWFLAALTALGFIAYIQIMSRDRKA